MSSDKKLNLEFLFGTEQSPVQGSAVAMLNFTMHFQIQPNLVIAPCYAISEFLFGTEQSPVQDFAVAMLNFTMPF